MARVSRKEQTKKRALWWRWRKKGEQTNLVRPVVDVVLVVLFVVVVPEKILSGAFSEEKRNSRDLRMSRTWLDKGNK